MYYRHNKARQEDNSLRWLFCTWCGCFGAYKLYNRQGSLSQVLQYHALPSVSRLFPATGGNFIFQQQDNDPKHYQSKLPTE